jgi:hypothetical protein
MKSTALVLVLSAAVPAFAGQSAPPPTDVVSVDAGTEQLNLWPFLTENYLPGAVGKSDPVNLIFLNTDPRAIRQRLMALGGTRSGWDFLPSGANGCVWIDGMGYEQAAYLEPEGWVGGAVQLVCTTPKSPLGAEYRFHVRLFRSGPHTIGGGHFEINTPGTAEHTVLSWEMARQFVTSEMARVDPASVKGQVPVWTPATMSFRTVNGLVYAYVLSKYPPLPTIPNNVAFYLALGIGPTASPYPDKPLPATGLAAVFDGGFEYVPQKQDITITDSRMYQVASTKKPLCDGEDIQITGGPLTFALRVQTNPSGKYQRTYTVSGRLKIKTLSTGEVQDAIISQSHRGMLTDHYGEVAAEDSQILLPSTTAVGQSGIVYFGAGQNDYWIPQQNCAIQP